MISWSGSGVKANFQVSKYVSLVGLMIVVFGITFEFPVLLVFLQMVGVLTPQTLMKRWRYATVIIFVIAAVITPSGDPVFHDGLGDPDDVVLRDLHRDRHDLPETKARAVPAAAELTRLGRERSSG